jgi:hypothetical protein
MMSTYRVLVIGGYGFFGRRLVERLARRKGLHVIVAGRREGSAKACASRFGGMRRALLDGTALDTTAATLPQDIQRLAPHAVVHTSGPFQGQGYHVAQACIAAGAHYIDLADGRQFVAGVTALDTAARTRGVSVTSGASSVPALSSAVADRLAQGLARVERIDIGISPGNRTERGLSTVQSILTYCGQPLPDSGLGRSFGWAGTWQHAYPAPVGTRLPSPCDVPDLTLLPARYQGTPSVRFGAGLELPFLHYGMNAMAWMAQRGLVRDWSAHAGWLKRAADWFMGWGTDAGAMHVTVAGTDTQGRACERRWCLVATAGDGPHVPTLAASALVCRLQAGAAPPAGARPCVGLLTLEDFEEQAAGLNIRMAEVAA